MLLEVNFEVSEAQPGLVSLCLLPADQDVKLSATALVPRLSAFCHDDHVLTL